MPKGDKIGQYTPVLKLIRTACERMAQVGGPARAEVFRTALKLAVTSRMEFARTDVANIRQYHPGGDMDVEAFYAMACEADNGSACRSVEACLARPPFLFRKKRLYVGANLEWEGRSVRVTSFGNDHRGAYVMVCAYRWEAVGEHRRQTVAARVKLTRDELKREERRLDGPRPHPDVNRVIRAFDPCERLRTHLRNHLTLKAAWDSWDDLYGAKAALLRVKFPIFAHELDAIRTVDDLRTRVGDFDQNLLPLIREAVRSELEARRVARAERREAARADGH